MRGKLAFDTRVQFQGKFRHFYPYFAHIIVYYKLISATLVGEHYAAPERGLFISFICQISK